EKNAKNIEDYWPSDGTDGDVELYHFIGKDIIRFHCLFWPGVLHAAGFKGPNKVFVHGFLTVNGEKMSKSKGTFVNARTYLDHLPPEALRYYYAAKLGGTTDDMDLNLADFVQRVNSDLVGKITNIASRGGQMLQKKLDGRLGVLDEEGAALVAKCREASEVIAKHYEDRRFNMALVEICRLADAANEYFDRREPWKTVKVDEQATRVTLTAALNAFRIIAIYLKPILPAYADKAMKLFGETQWTWDSIGATRENCTLGEYEYLASRIDSKQVEAMIAAATINPGDSGEVSHESRASKNKAKQEVAAVSTEVPALKPEISFGDFEKVDLRIGKVVSCETVPKSSKLLKFELDAGSLGKRTIFSGIRGSYPDPASLVGKEVLFVANLAPRKMSVGISEGMILYAGEPGVDGGILEPLASVPGGTPAT
ncbi:MAG: class I tRNA ligase family protein, partial [Kiritimatiellae bacterium]|nr:class I tRNA ligase family protein [Kiritimatiellia bacterium]